MQSEMKIAVYFKSKFRVTYTTIEHNTQKIMDLQRWGFPVTSATSR